MKSGMGSDVMSQTKALTRSATKCGDAYRKVVSTVLYCIVLCQSTYLKKFNCLWGEVTSISK
jgi:hypothetical protein